MKFLTCIFFIFLSLTSLSQEPKPTDQLDHPMQAEAQDDTERRYAYEAGQIRASLEFLQEYVGDNFHQSNWRITLMDGKVKLKKKWSLTTIVLHPAYFERAMRL